MYFTSSSIELTRDDVNSSSPLEHSVCKTCVVCRLIYKRKVWIWSKWEEIIVVMMQCFTSHLFCRSVLCPEVFAIFSLSLSQHASIIVIMWNTFLCFPVWYQAVIWHPRWDENLQNNYLLQNSNHLTAVSYWEMKLWKK